MTNPSATRADEAASDPRLGAIFRDWWEAQQRNFPTWATYLGDHRYDSLLTDYSPGAQENRRLQVREFLARIDSVPESGLSPADSLNYTLFRRMLADAVEGERFHDEWMPITQQGGPPSDFAELPTYHPMGTAHDVATYLARLDAFPALVDQMIVNMRAGMKARLVPARITMEMVLPQIEALMVRDARTSILVPASESLPKELSDEERGRLHNEIVRAVRDRVIPSYRKLHRFIRDHYVRACRPEEGIWALPDGADRYAYLVRHYTTTDMTPQAIYELGLQEVGTVRSQMRGVLNTLAYRGTLVDFMDALRINPRFYYTSPEELMQGFRAILSRMDKRLGDLFGRLPAQWYDLKELEAFRAPSAPAAYYYGAPDDGSRPAYFYVNTYRMDTRPKYTMEALAYHEAVPGHHLQLTLQQEMKNLPDFRRHGGYTAFVEGWALYSERLPKELGMYDDPYSEFGRLTFEAWRAVRLVVDTGIHHFKWTREQAIAYMKENTALSEVDIVSEVERYIAWPGQALAYKIGQLEILKLRAEAERTLKDNFDIRAFHDELLEEGALPLDILGARMEAWMARAEREARLGR
jgi:prolyl oligopeptidase